MQKFLSTTSKATLYTFLICLGFIVVYPLFWMLSSAFKDNAGIFGNPFALPTSLNWQNFFDAWNDGARNFVLVSVVVTVVTTVTTVLISAWAAYGLTRVRLKGNTVILGIVLGGLMISPIAALLPLVDEFQAIGLYNTIWALIVVYTAFRIPFTTFLLRSYMITLPRELDEAALIDGASKGLVFWRIIFPLCRPILYSAGVLHVLFAWNEYAMALVLTSSTKVEPLPVGLTSLMGRVNSNFGEIFAAMCIAAAPIIILFFVSQRLFVRGLAEGSGK
ncbi:carbohydrate ABC transporter permease [Spelaeicoccus albus]|uniref:Raffinose/stachyose/melibiose transport system permease protein n=1 Tax=Spelaeicoccus albus TaxID=1280376 RepID=A0A7Z0D256_9MICO|nr:carbohydrate ABC transporter permease [Spelaeicoccus albus]NYI67479.1 raffinose/stachyose/melibiose transport system permease protein [Spelaeicoccus albus]